jgi:glyoxylase-like metal-dependent hydrolase (beta-lactamase superfamily II)
MDLAGFLSEAAPAYGAVLRAGPGIGRIVAPNAGPMTYHGTNSWLLEEPDGFTLIDPGPNEPSHIAAILAATGGQLRTILLTHTHDDHLGATDAVQAATGAPVLAWGTPWAEGFAPTRALADGERIGSLSALHTPGHASDHLCFAHTSGVVFTGDHVMSWSTSIVSPTDGSMLAYMNSLRLLLAREDTLYLPGHGPPLPDPSSLVRGMLGHRLMREAAIMRCLEAGPTTEAAVVAALYVGLADHLVHAAARSVRAHLFKLRAEGKARCHEGRWEALTTDDRRPADDRTETGG